MKRRQGQRGTGGKSSFLVVLVVLLSCPVPAMAFLQMLQYALTEIIDFIAIRTIGPSCKTLPTIPDFDFDRYIAKSWFVQKHHVTERIDYSERYCIAYTYTTVNQTTPGKAHLIKYHTGQGGGGVNNNPYIAAEYCITKDGEGGRFKQGFCQWPPFLVFLAGPWYIVATDYDNYAIATGGPLSVRGDCDTASGLCRLANRGELFDPGSWYQHRQGIFFFTRDPMPSNDVMEIMEQKALELGICTAGMLPVTQNGCDYKGAQLKT